ncbi:long-chain fatty acid transporter [Alteromonas sp. KS69]|jgi:long-chain fatty acid transport protein|uniref:OmpP1/FadL family transporter n=1 Tax=unclassified Alteromonas TaxID=2614992 RepID=UPI000F87106C|nr:MULTISPECIES: outer membrane protein transport protein [unclassified Alteromonas]MBO7921165.1 outer membrane protein transport protein [Alteromonas sp. K632G]RUP75198.1 long-chain fatty acid transporter [Alteromonas sp. KS69]|tara:strand:+ start:20325 stop:21680 length:1356 start_codon:yes stop_codon:yes gene_type:complete
MKQHFSLRASVCLALASMASSSVLAAGFQVNEHSANGLGRAMAGQAAKPENASILATNPAAIGVFKEAEFSASVSFIDPNVDISGNVTYSFGDTLVGGGVAKEDNIAETAFVPGFFYVSPINDNFSAGVGVFTTYGLRSDYSDDFGALHFADTAEVKTVTVNPALSYKVNKQLMVGFGLNVTYAEAEIGSGVSNTLAATIEGLEPTAQALGITLPSLNAGSSLFSMEGDDVGFGWNVGVFWQPSELTNIALSHRAETKLELDGAVSSETPVFPIELNQPGSLDLNLAAITELAIDQKIDDQWSVQASLTFTDWSTFQKLEANLEDGENFLIKEENFDDSWRGSIGVTYILNDEFTLRAGYAYDDGVVSVENRSLSIPDTDRHWISGGLTYTMSENTSIDAAYVFIDGREAYINKDRTILSDVLPNTDFTTNFTGTQSATAHILSVQMNTRF